MSVERVIDGIRFRHMGAMRRKAWDRAVRRRSTVRQLTHRQRQVLELLAEGRTRGEIAEELGITPSTVTYHLRKARGRLTTTSPEVLIVLSPVLTSSPAGGLRPTPGEPSSRATPD